MKSSTILLLTTLGTACISAADWRQDVGWDQLQEWASQEGITLPNADALTLGMVEATTTVNNNDGYAPDPANAQLSDETIVDISQSPSTVFSGHATGVASHFFGNALGS